jgi:poly(3-hydroxybutyrate) depolymerase
MRSPFPTNFSKPNSWPSPFARQMRVLLVALGMAVSALSAVAGWNTEEEDIEGHPTWIYTPTHALPNGKHPLLIVLHGCAQTHTQLKTFGNLANAAEANGVVLAVPFVGLEFFGTPLQQCWDYHEARDNRHHIAELVRLADTLKARTALNVDPRHVYIAGLSSGATMALAVSCKAPDVFAGVGAVAGPSVGSSQCMALSPGAAIPRTNVCDAIRTCRSLAANKASHFATQIANIAYGDMDLDGPKAMFAPSPTDTEHAGQYKLVSTRWSEDNAKVLQEIYGTGALGPEESVQNGLGTLQVAKKGNDSRLSLLVVHDVGHAWPAGTDVPNDTGQSGQWIALRGLNYPAFLVDWLISNNLRARSSQRIRHHRRVYRCLTPAGKYSGSSNGRSVTLGSCFSTGI